MYKNNNKIFKKKKKTIKKKIRNELRVKCENNKILLPVCFFVFLV